MIRPAGLWCVAFLGMLASVVHAAEAKVETVLEGLHNPTGVAVQPETNVVYVAESGAGRVIRVVDGKPQEVVTGFAKEAKGLAESYDIGPLGLAFIEKDLLVVGEGGKTAGDDALLAFKTPAATEKSITVDQAKFTLPLPDANGAAAEGNFYGVAATKAGVYVTGTGDPNKGWLSKADTNGTKVENFRRFIATKDLVQAESPGGITISARGDLVVGQQGSATAVEDSLLSFYNAKDGKLLANFRTGLRDIVALAYSPSGQLYALDIAWHDASQGGLFQLIAVRDGSSNVKAEKIASLEKPTAMAFAPDGTLYITVLGGKLLKVAPGL